MTAFCYKIISVTAVQKYVLKVVEFAIFFLQKFMYSYVFMDHTVHIDYSST